MARPKGSKNKARTVKASVDYVAVIAEKAAKKEKIESEVATLTANLDDLKTQLKAKKAELKAATKELAKAENKKAAAEAKAAEEAGADYVGAEDYVAKIQQENWFDFDVVIASPDMMGVISRLGKVLGPKGLMPNPKAGTVTPDVAKAVAEAKAGKIEYRLDKTNIIHCPVGKMSFGAEKLQENFDTLLGAIIKAKPAAAKGQYIRSCVIATTMGPGIKVNTAKLG